MVKCESRTAEGTFDINWHEKTENRSVFFFIRNETRVFTCGILAIFPEKMKKKYFTKAGASYRISDEIKSRVEVKESNLLKDPYPTGCHLIVCRNVLIYFTEEAKDDVFRKFQKSLSRGGILFIGSTEQIMNYKEMGYGRKNSFFYIAE